MHYLIKAFIPTANLIAKTFGSSCEVVLHDITKPKNSVVYVAGSVTGRQIGQSFDHLITQVILSKDFKDDFTANYYFTAANGKRIKSSTSLIRDENAEAIGAVCINIDISLASELFKIFGEFLGDKDVLQSEQSSNEIAQSTEDIVKIVENLIDKIIGQRDTQGLKKDEKKELVRFMEQRGIFAVKGAFDMVATRLNISKVSVYAYIDEIRKQSAV